MRSRERVWLGWLGAGLVALCTVACSGDKAETGGDGDPDADGDGVPASEDCDDTDPSVYPGAVEDCDGKDNDCDGATDLEDADVVGVASAPIDSDGDGYGEAGRTADFCAGNPPDNVADNADDCDDRDDTINPEGNEICDGEDNDCDGLVDGEDGDAIAIPTWSQDRDGDGYGDAEAGFRSCEDPGTGYVENALDCDDSNPAIRPEAREFCGDGVDSDCDGSDGVDRFAGDGELTCAYVLVDGATGVLAGGDLDADGAPELVVAGAAEVSVLGEPLDGNTLTESLGDGTVGATAVGDLDGDGAVDLVVATSTGAVLVHQGPLTGSPDLVELVVLDAGGVPSALWAGSVGSDNMALVGRPGSDLEQVQDGVSQTVLVGEGTRGLGSSIDAVGDVTGDGLPDWAVGAEDGDTVLVVSDWNGSDFEGVLTLEGEGGFGAAVSGIADVDGDGLDDILVGAPEHGEGAGAVFAVLADGTVFSRMDGPEGGAAGTAVDAIGDLNQDGFADVVVGTPGADGGRADVIIGPVPEGTMGTLELVAFQLTGDGPGDAAGAAVLGGVDFNADGYHDFVVSIPGADQTAIFLGVRSW